MFTYKHKIMSGNREVSTEAATKEALDAARNQSHMEVIYYGNQFNTTDQYNADTADAAGTARTEKKRRRKDSRYCR
jgi:hypothetical protein